MAPFVHLVHGIDKAKRLKELDKEARKNDRIIDCLLQIHIAKEDSKFGFDEAEAEEVLANNPAEKYPNVRIRGLMGMATFSDNEQEVRNILSMGMSGDYQLAIDENSTMVRIGSSIFGGRNQSK